MKWLIFKHTFSTDALTNSMDALDALQRYPTFCQLNEIT